MPWGFTGVTFVDPVRAEIMVIASEVEAQRKLTIAIVMSCFSTLRQAWLLIRCTDHDFKAVVRVSQSTVPSLLGTANAVSTSFFRDFTPHATGAASHYHHHSQQSATQPEL